MKDLFEEMKELSLDEDLPKDLAAAFRRGSEVPRGADDMRWGYGNIARRPDIDFKNSTYTEITPEEALKLYKAGDSKNVFAILGGQLANTYLTTDENGAQKRAYDFKATSDGSEAFRKDNGKMGGNSMWLSPKEFYKNASKIYLANEVKVDPDLRSERAKNPESRYSDYNRRGSARDIANKKIPKPTPRSDEFYPNRMFNQIDFDDNGNARYRNTYVNRVYVNGQNLDYQQFYPVEVWKEVAKEFLNRWGSTDTDYQSAQYIVDKLSGRLDAKTPDAFSWSTHDKLQREKAGLRYKDVENDLQRVIQQGRGIVSQLSDIKSNLDYETRQKDRYTSPQAVARRKEELQRSIAAYQDRINRYMQELLQYQDRLDDVDTNNDAEIAKYDARIADLQDNIAKLQKDMKGLFKKKTEDLQEDLELIQLTPNDQAVNIRSLIKACWDNVDQFSMFAQQLNEFGSQTALNTVNTLINDLYIAIGSFEEELNDVDPKAAAIEAPEQIQVVAEVAPQVVQQMAQPQMMPVLEKFQLAEDDILTEDLAEKPEVQEEIEEPIKKELKEVEKYREEKVKDSMNPDTDDVIEETSDMKIVEDLGEDESYNPKFLESLLKLEED